MNKKILKATATTGGSIAGGALGFAGSSALITATAAEGTAGAALITSGLAAIGTTMMAGLAVVTVPVAVGAIAGGKLLSSIVNKYKS